MRLGGMFAPPSREFTPLSSVFATIKGNLLAKPNYQFEKRQRDLAKKSKQEEKRQQKLANKAAEEGESSVVPPLAITPSETTPEA